MKFSKLTVCLTFTVMLTFINGTLTGQIYPGLGIAPFDSILFDDNRSHPLLDVYSQTTCNEWQVGVPQKPGFDSAHSPHIAIITDTISSYQPGANNFFDLKVPYDPPYNPVISFYHKYDTDSLSEGCVIEISHDNGISFTNIVYDTLNDFNASFGVSGLENVYSKDDMLDMKMPGFTGKSNGWERVRIQKICDLPIKQGCGFDTTIFRFRFISDTIETNKGGWIIDDIVLSETMIAGSVKDMTAEDDEITIYPNPADREIFIKLKGIDSCDIESVIVTTMEGFTMMMDVYNGSLYVGHLQPGHYIINLYLNNGKKIIGSFIKN